MRAHPDEIGVPRTARKVRKLSRQGRRAAVISIEGGHALEGDLARLVDWHARGVRAVGLTHFNANDLADSATDVRRHGGIIDVSHASDEPFWQTLELSTQPIMASHSSARALTNHPRNLTDEMICALARKDGLIGVTCWPEYISDSFCRSLERYSDGISPTRKVTRGSNVRNSRTSGADR